MVCIFRSLQSLSILCWFGTQPWFAILVFLIDGASLLYYTLWTIWIKQDKAMINFQGITLGNIIRKGQTVLFSLLKYYQYPLECAHNDTDDSLIYLRGIV